MSKYEIMVIFNPNADIEILKQISNEVFKEDLKKFEKMDRTELAYEINHSKVATYFLINVETTGKNIVEFKRRCSIKSEIWRIMIINTDTEKGLHRVVKPGKKNYMYKKNSNNYKNNNTNINRRQYSNQNFSKDKETK